MDRIYVFIIRNDVWMLILAIMGLIWYISDYLRARGQLKRAVFGLERERSSQRRNNALLFILMLSAVIGLILYVNFKVAPTLPATTLRPEMVPPALGTPLTSPTAVPTIQPTATPPLVPTITLASQPGIPPALNDINIEEQSGITETQNLDGTTAVSSPTLNAPPTPFVSCNLQLTISEPRTGAVISEPIEFFGTVNTPDFGGYKLEANGPQTNGQWASLLGRTVEQTVQDGLLGNVNLTEWESGPYIIRLTAVNSNQNDIYQCVIQITLENE